ncbi:MAG: CRISPR-associated helicase Cas3' [Gemmataceae bacterium]
MNLSILLWAKLGRASWPEEFHPVLCHLIDVAAVTGKLWHDVFRAQFRRWIAERLGLNEESSARWLAFWCGAHDIGKVSPCFQSQGHSERLVARLRDAGFDFPGDSRLHGDLSTKVLAEMLDTPPDRRWPEVPTWLAQNVAVAVGGHHGIFPTNWDGICIPLGNDRWAAARCELLGELARLVGVTEQAPPNPVRTDDQSVWICLAGITSVADWIGSNQEFFKLIGNDDFVNKPFDADDYFKKANERADDALQRLGWLERANTTSSVTFAGLFPLLTNPRPLQTAVAEMVAERTKPHLLIVEAPMGEGKTEAAWYSAVCWDRCRGQGTYVALPTMATSNQMFERVGKFLEADTGGNLMLLHGKAALNEKFEKLKYAARNYDDERNPSAVVAEAWFASNKKHGLLAPYGVGTIDQALLAVLQTKHVFVRLFGLAGKCVILDEIHAYDAYMTTLMERLLRWQAALGCPVVLLSATLPKEKRLKLLRAYAGDDLPETENVPYPRLTSVAVGDQKAMVRHVEADPDRAQTILLGWLNESELVETLRQALADGGCAAVIRNTVGLAQATYLQLRDVLKTDGIEVELFHARFPFGRRAQIEEAVLKRFGKEGRLAERNKRVLVATQVVEQSLDLDFDVMISDVAPVDLVLQRAGRLHRHERGKRPAGVAETRLWLIEPEMKGGIPDFGISGFVYSPHILFRSMLSLKIDAARQRETLQLPSQIDVLVSRVYDDQAATNFLSLAEQAFWASTLIKHLDALDKEESEAESRQIKKPRFRGTLARILQEPREEDNPDLHPAHQALTRLSRPTVSLICLSKDSNGVYCLTHDNSPVRTLAIHKISEDGYKDIGRLLLAEITSADRGLLGELSLTPRIPREWSDFGLLCRHHLIVFTDGKARVGSIELELDNFLGLTITRNNDQGADE